VSYWFRGYFESISLQASHIISPGLNNYGYASKQARYRGAPRLEEGSTWMRGCIYEAGSRDPVPGQQTMAQASDYEIELIVQLLISGYQEHNKRSS
jgi:hypothetical protein